MESRLSLIRLLDVRNRAQFGLYKCLCGNEKEINIYNVRAGKTLSCGCYRNERVKEVHSNHTEDQDRAHKIWLGMKGRCFVKSNSAYKKYGAVGISCCDRWANSFANFWEDMGPPPEGYTLDRVDNTKGYFKENCRWPVYIYKLGIREGFSNLEA